MYVNSKYHSTTIKKSVSIVAVLRTSRKIKMFLFYIRALNGRLLAKTEIEFVLWNKQESSIRSDSEGGS